MSKNTMTLLGLAAIAVVVYFYMHKPKSKGPDGMAARGPDPDLDSTRKSRGQYTGSESLSRTDTSRAASGCNVGYQSCPPFESS